MLFSICSASVSLALKASLLQDWPQADMIPHRHPGSLKVTSTKEVTDPELLAEAATLVPVLRGGGALADGRDEFPRVRGWTAFTNHTVSWNAEELWHVEFDGRVPAGVGRAAMITIDTISNAGARIENTRKPHDHCWRLGCILPRVPTRSCGQARAGSGCRRWASTRRWT